MAADFRDLHLPRPLDAAALGSGITSDHPPTSSCSSPSSSSSDRNVKLHCSYGGLILPRGTDGALRYIGGTTRLITAPRDSSLPDILRRMAELCGGPVVLRYQLPEDDIDSLVSVLSAEDLEHMMEEHDRLAADCPNAKLRVFLFSPSGAAPVRADVLASYHDPHDSGMRYLGAYDGFWSSRFRNDGTTSLSSAQDSDAGAMNQGTGNVMETDGVTQDLGGGATTTEAMVNESLGTGTVTDGCVLPANVPITSTSARSDSDLPSGTSSSNQTELSSNQSPLELPSLVPNKSRFSCSIHAELSYVPPYVPQHHAENQHAEMRNSQCFFLVGFSTVGLLGFPVHITAPTFLAANETSFPTRLNSHLKNPSVANTTVLPGDVYFQPLPQLPPLPSPHLLAPNVGRNEPHQVASSSQGLATIIEDCSLDGKALLPVPSDAPTTCKKRNDSKDVVSDANAVFPSHQPEDLARIRAPLGVNVRSLVDRGVEIQSENFVAAVPSKTYEHPETIAETSQGRERVDLSDILIPPFSVCIPATSQTPYANVINPQKCCDILTPPVSLCVPTTSQVSYTTGTIANPPKSCEVANLDLADILIPPVSVCMPTTLSASYPIGTATNTPKSCDGVNLDLADILVPPVSVCMPTNSQTSTVNIGFSKHAVNQDVNSKPLVSDPSLVRNLEARTDGITTHGTAPTLLHDCVRPIDLAIGALSKIPPGSPVFNDHPRPAVMSDICSSKYINPDGLPSFTVNTHNTGQNNGANEPSVSNPLMSSVVIPGASTDHVIIDHQPSVVRDVAYLQCIQPTNSSHSSNTAMVHVPYSYHVEGGVGQRGMFKHLDTAYSNNDATKNPIVKDNAPILHPVDKLSDKAISQTGISPIYSSCHTTNLDQLQKVVALDSIHISDMDTQNAQAISVPSKQSIITTEFLKNNCPVNGMRSEIIAPKESSLSNLPNFLNPNPTIKVGCPVQDLEEVCIKQDIQSFEGRVLEPAAEVPVPALSFRESKVINLDKEFGIVENNIAMENGQTEIIRTIQPQKIMHSFLNLDEIGSLQVIRNSDLEELQKLGSGSFGTVYHGKWRGSDVEIKRINDRVFSGKSSEQEHGRAIFWNEACKLASLHHPNVVAFYGIVLDDPGGSISTVTELMANGSLRSALQEKDNTLDRRGCLLIAMDVAFGMEYLHSKKIIHFDLRSDNLLVNLRDPQHPICKVGDLGLSKAKYDALVSGRMQESLPWMAPELFAGKDDECTEKVDVFSFGIVMWELLTREKPYGDMHYAAIIGGILKDTLRPPVPESCDAEWRSLMEQCWSTQPSQRPSFTEIAGRLRAMDAAVSDNR